MGRTAVARKLDSAGVQERSNVEPVGREIEEAAIGELLDDVPVRSGSLLLTGAPGIGKTTIWRWGVEEARRRGMTVLIARAAEPEAQASFATLADLLEPVLALASSLPEPQLEAFEAALMRRKARGAVDDRAVGAATVGILKALVAAETVIVALDDVQWIDPASAAALSHALRRLPQERIGALATERSLGEGKRGTDRGALVHALASGERFRRLEMEGLSAGALQAVLARELGHRFPRPLLLRVHRATSGNPLFALEMARAIRDRDVGPEEPLPVPADLRQLVLGRIRPLGPAIREVLILAAALPAPTIDVLARASGSEIDDALEAARDAGIVELEAGSVSFTHPLFASAVIAATPPHKLRRAHARLAQVLADPEEGARHLALATPEPDERVAQVLEDAARTARIRGSRAGSAELLAMAARLTPGAAAEAWGRRVIGAALNHHESGASEEAHRLIREAIDGLPSGRARAEAIWTLMYSEAEWDRAEGLAHQAIEEASGDANLEARIRLALAEWQWMANGIRSAVREADRAVELALADGDPALVTQTFAFAGHAHAAAGLPDGEATLRRALAGVPEDADIPPWSRPAHWLGCALMWMDRLDEARALLLEEYERSTNIGHDLDRAGLGFHLCQLEVRAGRITEAKTYGETAVELAGGPGDHDQLFVLVSAGLGSVEAFLGHFGEARSICARAVTVARRLGDRLSVFHHRGVLGFVELSAGNPRGVLEQLDGMVEELDDLGVGEPGLYPFVPDEIEARIALGSLDEAERLVAPLEDRGRELDRPRLLATGARSRGLLLAARGRMDEAQDALQEAITYHERLPVPFERGRSLLARGQVERRLKHKRAARESLEEAARVFESLPAPLWAAKARHELGRIGGRAPSSRELTPTEQRIADAVAEGLSNREVAEAVFVSIHTVEANLSRIYAKLGVRSRTELTRLMGRREPTES